MSDAPMEDEDAVMVTAQDLEALRTLLAKEEDALRWSREEGIACFERTHATNVAQYRRLLAALQVDTRVVVEGRGYGDWGLRYLLFHMPSRRGWQLSWFGHDGKPTGHTVRATFAAAVEEFLMDVTAESIAVHHTTARKL